MHEQPDRTSSFGVWLRRQRKTRDWTQAELAQRVGCAADTIGKIETEVRRPSRQLVARIATVLAIPAAERAAILQAARSPRALDHLPLAAQPVGAAHAPPLAAARREAGTPTLAPPQHQLRTPLPDFLGQQAAIATLLAAMQRATQGGTVAAISGVHGMGGIGKTELAYVVANRLCGIFPDAQIVIALRGTSAVPLPSEHALQQVIHAFTPEAALPDDLAALQAHYLAVLHGQRVLILADDVRDAAQVRPLLPPAGCALLMTSRQRFSLPGMTTVDLELFSENEAITLLRGICPRLNVDEAQALARACGRLALALRISGSILRNDPALSVAGYLAKLADERLRLSYLRDPDDPHLDVAASLALSYAQLDAVSQRVFRQLGICVADFATELALAVIEAPVDVDVEMVLHLLLRRNLIIYDAARARWRLHDLLCNLARISLEGAGEWDATMWRYAQAAVQIAQVTQGQYRAGGDGTLIALARFDTERPHIDAARTWVASQIGTPAGDALLVADALATYDIGHLRYHWRRERIPQLERALAAARRTGDGSGEGTVLNSLGIIYLNLGDPRQASCFYEQRCAIAQALGDRHGEWQALNNLGFAYGRLGDTRRAVLYYERAVANAQAIGNRRSEGSTLCNLGKAYVDLGDLQRAVATLEQALACFREIGGQVGEAVVLDNLGLAYLELGEVPRAIDCCLSALKIAQAIGDRSLEGYALRGLGSGYAALDDRARAQDAFEAALTLFRTIGDRQGEADCCWQFGLALASWGERDRALALLRAAVAYEEEIGYAKAVEHAASLAQLEAGEAAPAEILH